MEYQYLALLRELLEHGVAREDRTGTGTRSVFGRLYRHDLTTGFPLLTTKKVHWRSVVQELLWFLRGDTNTRYLREHGVSIWDEWATPEGELGPVYGAQWRAWRGADGTVYDQVSALIEGLRRNPSSRRHIISAWNVAQLPDERLSPQANAAAGRMALAPCHVLYQFYVSEGGLSCMLTQRSADIFLGLPFNAASASLLTHLVAAQCDLAPRELVHSIGDLHLYRNHVTQARLQLERTPRALPTLAITRRAPTIFDYTQDDLVLAGYDPHPAIPAPIAV
ncbi:MAG TPA: thymidylate synthase [Acidiferrobacteraceae bacterium]|nr:thymidylate synthase [Acidiferrobacteraceae bacterium]